MAVQHFAACAARRATGGRGRAGAVGAVAARRGARRVRFYRLFNDGNTRSDAAGGGGAAVEAVDAGREAGDALWAPWRVLEWSRLHRPLTRTLRWGSWSAATQVAVVVATLRHAAAWRSLPKPCFSGRVDRGATHCASAYLEPRNGPGCPVRWKDQRRALAGELWAAGAGNGPPTWAVAAATWRLVLQISRVGGRMPRRGRRQMLRCSDAAPREIP